MTERTSKFWGVRDGRVGLLSGWHALIAGLVVGAAAVWVPNWWVVAAMAFLVLRAVVALRLARTRVRPGAGSAEDPHAHTGRR